MANATICTKEGKDVVLYIWYDNEFGYTKQVIRLAKQLNLLILLFIPTLSFVSSLVTIKILSPFPSTSILLILLSS